MMMVKSQSMEILRNIDDEIKLAFENGTQKVAYSTPIYFSIPNLENSDAQREVYYCVIKSLLDRRFNVQHELTRDKSILHITWISKDKQKIIDAQNAFLAQHRSH